MTAAPSKPGTAATSPACPTCVSLIPRSSSAIALISPQSYPWGKGKGLFRKRDGRAADLEVTTMVRRAMSGLRHLAAG